MNSDGTESAWHTRTVDLSSFAGKTAVNLWVTADSGTPVGSWNSWFFDIAIYSADGSVISIYNRQTSTGLTYWTGGGETTTGAIVERSNTASDSELPGNTTSYYVADQIGSARMLMAAEGWPVSSDTYYPYGVEQYASADTNHYKFTGKERDSESGLDYFGARYYSSNVGRFMSPDWSAKVEPVPYAKLDNPQSLNLYSYVDDNPLSRADKDGHIGNCAPGINGTAQTTTCKQKAAGELESQEKAQQQNSAAVVASPATMEEIDAIVGPLVESAVGALEAGGTAVVGGAAGVLAVMFADPQQTASESQDTIHQTSTTSPEPQAAAGGAGAMKGGGTYGSTPDGRPFTKHYGTETGPVRNISGSVIDHVVKTTSGVAVGGGKTMHYDAVNNVTVITGNGGSIVSARKDNPNVISASAW